MSEPKRYTRLYPTSRTIEHVLDYRGTQELPERPLSLQCDFCNRHSDRLWCRNVRPFSVEMWPRLRMEYQGGDWCACVFCNPMVDARDTPLLLARISIVNEEARGVPVSGFERLYNAVFDAMEGAPAVLWNAGEVWPVKRKEATA